MWLRRIIDMKLSARFGPNYLEATAPDGRNVISLRIRRPMLKRWMAEPQRYPRPIDAALLEDVVDIITNPELYNIFFKEALRSAYPVGREHAKAMLSKIAAVRNPLSHAGPASVRQIEQAICYSNDAIDAIKRFYEETNMGNEFNVPMIVRFSDSLGKVVHGSQFVDGGTQRFAIQPSIPLGTLRTGDILSLEVEVDPTFPRESYTVAWHSPAGCELQDGLRLTLTLAPRHVSIQTIFRAIVKSKRDWHRFHDCDDKLLLLYTVLPPAR